MNIIPNNIIITPADNDATTSEITLSADFCFLIPITARTIPTKATAIIDTNNASEVVGVIHSNIKNPQTSPARNNAKVLNLLFSPRFFALAAFCLRTGSDFVYFRKALIIR